MNAFRNLERQKSILKDTDRLLKLTQELANTEPQSLNSPENLKKFAEVEKLAKRIKQHMKGD